MRLKEEMDQLLVSFERKIESYSRPSLQLDPPVANHETRRKVVDRDLASEEKETVKRDLGEEQSAGRLPSPQKRQPVLTSVASRRNTLVVMFFAK